MKLLYGFLVMVSVVEGADVPGKQQLSLRARRKLPPLPLLKIVQTNFKQEKGYKYADEHALYCVAAFESAQEIERMLCDKDTDPNVVDPTNGMTPLMYAAMHGNQAVVNSLKLDPRVDFNQTDKLGYNALMHAVVRFPDKKPMSYQYIVILKVLAARTNLDHVAGNGKTVKDIAVQMGRGDVVELLSMVSSVVVEQVMLQEK